MLVFLALCSIFVPQAFGGVRLPGCSNNRLQVDEGNNVMITCDQTGSQGTVLWYIDRNEKQQALGSCPPVGSTCFPQYIFDLSRTSTQSTVTSQPPSYIREFKKIRCSKQGESSNQAECALDVVYPAEMTSASCKVEAKSESWRVEGSCDITKTFSSMGYYKCQVYEGTNQSPTNLIQNGSYNTSLHSDSKYRTGSCSFNHNIANLQTQGMTTHNFFFKFTVYPGPKDVVKGPVIIERPATPTMTCPAIIGENVAFTCTCTTTKIGRPAGRLYWSLKNVVQAEGNYGDTTLTTRTLTLNRGDNGQTKISCGLRWAVDVGSDVYTANVGFPPSRTVLQINSRSTTTTSVAVSENSPVSFTCTATGGNPTSSLTLSDRQSTISSNENSTLTHSLGPGQCEHTGPYTCTASNGYGDAVTATSTLFVQCAPRGDEDIGAVNFINDSVSVSFDVTAYPAPNRVTFNFLGKNGTEASVDIDRNSITMNGSCVQTTPVYKSTCTVTVSSVKREAAAGFYQVNVHNNINTGTGSFKLKVKFRAEPVIDKQTGGDEGPPVAAIVGGVVTAVVVIIVIAVIVLFIMKRRKGPGKERLESTESAADHINGREMSAVTHQQPPTGALTFSPQDEYAVVNKPKEPAGAAAPATAATVATTDSEQPNDTYAVVDKKAKKKAEPGVKDGTKVKKKANPGVKGGAKAKPTKKETKAEVMDEGAHLYGNVEDTKPVKKKKKSPPAPKEEAPNTKPNINQDGLLYSDVVFTKSPTEHPTPVPVEEGVVYSAVDFTQTAPPM